MLLMDIGGWTVGLMRLVNGIPNASACRSLELGMIRCIDEAKEQIRRETGLSVTDAQVEHVLARQTKSVSRFARNILDCIHHVRLSISKIVASYSLRKMSEHIELKVQIALFVLVSMFVSSTFKEQRIC